MLMLANAIPAYGQSSASPQRPATEQQKILVDQAFLIEAEKAIADRQRLQAVTAAQAEIILAKDQQIAALRGLLQVQQQISQDWKSAATARADALKVDDRLLIQYDKRIAQLQSDLAAAKRNGRWVSAGAFVLGAALAVLAGRE
jgi:hypothetical protein